jgi:hypothetical protein
MAKVLILQAVHFHVPGQPMTAHATKASADVVAAEYVNELFAWIEQPQDAKPETWEADLERARKARAEQMGCDDPDDLGEDDGDVWITELEVEVPMIGRMLDLLDRIHARLDQDHGDSVMFLFNEIGCLIAEAKGEYSPEEVANG